MESDMKNDNGKNCVKDMNLKTIEFCSENKKESLIDAEKKAIDNLVLLSTLKSDKESKQFSFLPSVECIREFLDCVKCKSQRIESRIQALIYSCIKNDFSTLECCFKKQDDRVCVKKLDDKVCYKKQDDKVCFSDTSKNIEGDNQGSSSQPEENKIDQSVDIDLINDSTTDLDIDDSTSKKHPYKIKLPLKRNQSTKKKKVAPLVCHKCQNVFTTKNGLKYHLTFVHTVENENVVKPFICPFTETCSRKYKNKNGLFYHLQHHHGKGENKIDGMYPKKENILKTAEL